MRDGFDLVIEAANRGMESVTIDMLKVFINRYLQDTLAKAGRKVNLAMESFDDTRGEMGEMWQYLRGQLIELAADTREALVKIGNEAVAAAQQVRLGHDIANELPRVIQRTSARVGKGADWLARSLVVIMIVELLAYLVFFWRQHARTHGFKKVD
jgi:hypothetical protein